MAIKFFNTMSRSLEEFKPIKEGKVGLYTCGPTVYDFAHIGNFRTYVFEDILRRYLEYKGFKVKHVMNITDVDDKTIRKAREGHKALSEVTEPFIEAFLADIDTLNIERATIYPRATKHIDDMVRMIRKLMEQGIAYKSSDGSIYFDIRKFPAYGRLAHIKVDELQSGARVAQDEYEKGTASDFALWKAWDENDGDVYWDQYEDLGKGRPGWHIECSAMSTKYLGNHFDLHTGGVDNIFPHHQNEIAQTEACTHETFVNYWMHSEHLQAEGQKMSKSLGNFFTLRMLLDKDKNPSGKAWKPMAVRYLLVATHYHTRLDFTFKGLQAATETLRGLAEFLRDCAGSKSDKLDTRCGVELTALLERAKGEFERAMDDDLNTPVALAALFTLRNNVKKLIAKYGDLGPVGGKLVVDFFADCDRVLGLRLLESVKELEEEVQDALEPELQALLEERQKARKERNFARADELRQELLSRGIAIMDTPQGVTWKRV